VRYYGVFVFASFFLFVSFLVVMFFRIFFFYLESTGWRVCVEASVSSDP